MAIEIRHTCSVHSEDFLTVNVSSDGEVFLDGVLDERNVQIVFDIPTAIKFAKTLRTKINEAKEVSND